MGNLQDLIQALRDTGQSASNAIAGNVAGPVDLISAGLRGVGLPIPQNPVGGSQWMAEKGLTREVPMGAPRIIGETLGMAGPAVVAAKAPQIAGGLLQMGDNLAAPRTLNPQTGAIVWHGSPHKFDKFDSSKIGTGEGNQAYGHGLYLAESREVGEDYAKVLSSPRNRVMSKQGVYIEPSPMRDGTYRLAQGSEVGQMRGRVGDATQGLTDYEFPSLSAAIRAAKKQGYLPREGRPLLNALGEDGKYVPIRRAADVTEDVFGHGPEYAQFMASEPGNLYKVDLPDEQIARMLDWDKPLSQQSDAAQYLGRMVQKRLGPKAPQEMTGYQLYESLTPIKGGQAEAAQFMRDSGIPGIRYLDGGSRGAGAGTSNFVVFPGNEDILKILERNGQGLLR